MPRTPIKLPEHIEYLSILDEHGKLDQSLEPGLSSDDLKTLYRYMLLARRTDERMLIMQRQGRLATFPQASGHEAVSLGAAFVINKNDWFVPYYRELAGMLYRGWPLENILLYWNGFEEGASVPEGVNDLPFCVPIASQLLHAVGIGMAINIKRQKQVVLTFFGDGASSEGDCHEAMNFASVFGAPVVFICLNNQYAISVPVSHQLKAETIAQRAIAYGMDGIRVDGNDILAVYAATKEAVDKARNGGGPTLIEALTYRLTPHTTADDPKRYRSEKEAAVWQAREPMKRFKAYLYDKKILSPIDEEQMEAEIDRQIKLAVEREETLAKGNELNDPLRIFDYLYAEMTPCLQRQKDELSEYLQAKRQSLHPGKNSKGR